MFKYQSRIYPSDRHMKIKRERRQEILWPIWLYQNELGEATEDGEIPEQIEPVFRPPLPTHRSACTQTASVEIVQG